MTRFLNHTLTDIRGGRDSWRVITIASAVSFLVAIVVQSAQLF